MSKAKKTAEKGYCLTAETAKFSLLTLADGSEERMLQSLFGGRYTSLMAREEKFADSPVLVLATEFLDKGDLRDGEQSWVFGWYMVWVTTSDFRSKMVPTLLDAPSYSGHLYSGDHQLARATVLWAGMLNEYPEPGIVSGGVEPGLILYIRPEQREYRDAVRTAAALGTLNREFKMSLRYPKGLEVDAETLKVKSFPNMGENSVDFVMNQGTKGASVKSPLLLNNNEQDSEDETMKIEFSDKDAMLRDRDVRSEIDSQVEYELSRPQRIAEIVLKAPVDVVLKREDAKKAFENKSREEVLKSVTDKELAVILEGNSKLMTTVIELTAKHNGKVKTFMTETVRPMLTARGFSPEQANRVLAQQEFTLCDREDASRKIELAAGLIGLPAAKGKGETEQMDRQDSALARTALANGGGGARRQRHSDTVTQRVIGER